MHRLKLAVLYWAASALFAMDSWGEPADRSENPPPVACAAGMAPEDAWAQGIDHWSSAVTIDCQDEGCSVDERSAHVLELGFQCATIAADAGLAEAQNELGYAYLHGDRGVAVDRRMAKQYFDLAAQGGDTYAMVNLAALYFFGVGTPVDRDRAEQLIRRAAASGNHDAHCILADGVQREFFRSGGRTPEELRLAATRLDDEDGAECQDSDLFETTYPDDGRRDYDCADFCAMSEQVEEFLGKTARSSATSRPGAALAQARGSRLDIAVWGYVCSRTT